MATLACENATIYYEDTGSGEPLVLIHGFTVNTTYWTQSGVVEKLAEKYRVITMDMRGHGRSETVGDPKGFNARTIGDDLDALADDLELSRFHLLGHSTGGMVAVRYAMRNGDRLQSLMLLDTSSATSLVPQYDNHARRRFVEAFAGQFRGKEWDEIFASFREKPGPLLSGLDLHPEREQLWQTYEDIARINDTETLAVFAHSFFWDPDFRREQLRQIPFPTLILVGEHDTTFVEPSEIMAGEIPHAKHVVMEGVGHMDAIEAPDRVLEEILAFLESISQD